LLTDVVMPGLGGREVREAVSAHHPEAAVLFMSGYAEGPHPGVGADGSAPAGFLAKPFTVRRLAAEVARMLDSRATGGSGPAAEAPAGAAGPLH
ncbi:MAG: hybrid sensor histidine kinase/response regulator, partial [Gammaproteobacteria bacterium]|nr:hybrid sensor histidine kinase/response regulator [Gammaproteobacteria bacterium]